MTCFVILAVGMLIQIVGFVGCCGAAKEASSMLCCYVLVQILITFTLVSEYPMVRRGRSQGATGEWNKRFTEALPVRTTSIKYNY